MQWYLGGRAVTKKASAFTSAAAPFAGIACTSLFSVSFCETGMDVYTPTKELCK